MMKQFLCLVIALLMLLLISGCSKETQSLPELSDYNSEAFFPVGDNSRPAQSDGNSEHTAQNSGFVVRDRKYTYEGYDVVILNVENQTEQNYSITINGAYLDENGEVLQEETQTFEGFEAGWNNYFLFQPDLTFDSFTYTLDVQEFSGECVASKMEIEWKPGEVTRTLTAFSPVTNDFDTRLVLDTHLYFTNIGTDPMKIYYHVVILDSEGEIFRVNQQRLYASSRTPYDGTYPPQETHDKPLYLTYGLPDEKVSLPDELQDGFTLLIALTSAEWDPTWTN